MNSQQRLFGLIAIAVALATPSFAQAATIVTGGTSEPILAALDRISWSAVFAGLVVAVATHIALSMLGLGIGVGAIDPQNHRNPTTGVPTMLLIWMFASGLTALFVGGYVSGRLAGTEPYDSALHGIVTWALSTIAIFLLATTSAGILVGSTFKLLGQGISGAAQVVGAGASGAAQAVGAAAPAVAGLAKDAMAEVVPQFDWKSSAMPSGCSSRRSAMANRAGSKATTTNRSARCSRTLTAPSARTSRPATAKNC